MKMVDGGVLDRGHSKEEYCELRRLQVHLNVLQVILGISVCRLKESVPSL